MDRSGGGLFAWRRLLAAAWLAAGVSVGVCAPVARRSVPEAPEPEPDGGWVTFHWEGGLSPYGQVDLKLSAGGVLEFATEHMKQPAKAVYQLTPAEVMYLRSLIVPLHALDGKGISQMATDVGNSSLRIRRPDGAVQRLDWVHTDQPDVIAWRHFVWRLAQKEYYRRAVRLDNRRLSSDMRGLSSDIGRMFRPEELREQIWRIVEQRPLIGYDPLKDTSPLGDALGVLSLWDSPEERAGHVLQVTESLSPDDKLRAAHALSSYVINHAEDRPWQRLTPFSVEALRYAGSIPGPRPGHERWQDSTRANVKAAVRVLAGPGSPGDPRARAALADHSSQGGE
jgi:hypothetical protein